MIYYKKGGYLMKTGSSIGFSGILTIIFVIAKILGLIDWSWWWVFSPLWIGMIFLIVIIFGLVWIDRSS